MCFYFAFWKIESFYSTSFCKINRCNPRRLFQELSFVLLSSACAGVIAIGFYALLTPWINNNGGAGQRLYSDFF